MKQQKTTTFESVTTPGVKFTLHNVTEGRRNTLRQKIMADLCAARTLQEVIASDHAPVAERHEAALKMEMLNEAFQLETLRHFLVSIEGLTNENDQPITIDEIFMDGPQALYEELKQVNSSRSAFTAEQEKNSEPLTTSEPVGSGQTSGINADDAERTGSISLETAASTSPS